MITVECECGKTLKLKDELAGKKVRCPECKESITVPVEDEDEDEGITDKPKSKMAARRSDEDDDDEGSEDRPKKKRSRKKDDEDEGSGELATSGKATAALLLGLAACCVPGMTLPAVILGIMAFMDIGNQPYKLKGKGLAIVGIISGVLGPVVLTMMILVVFFLGGFALIAGGVGVAQVAAKSETTNNLKQISLAAHGHHDAMKTMPSPSTPSGLSWRVSLLPYLDEGPLFNQIQTQQAWDAPANVGFQNRRPKVYDSKMRLLLDQRMTSFQTTVGPNGLFKDKDHRVRMIQDIPDGTSNTIFAIDAKSSVIWTRPADLTIDNAKPLPSALEGDGFLASFVDGTVRYINRKKVDDKTLRLMIDPRDGQMIPQHLLD